MKRVFHVYRLKNAENKHNWRYMATGRIAIDDLPDIHNAIVLVEKCLGHKLPFPSAVIEYWLAPCPMKRENFVMMRIYDGGDKHYIVSPIRLHHLENNVENRWMRLA